jgi:hypothetical protein
VTIDEMTLEEIAEECLAEWRALAERRIVEGDDNA